MIVILWWFIKLISIILKKKHTQKYVILSDLFIKLINCSHLSNSHHVTLVNHRKKKSIGYFRVYFIRIIQLCDWGIVREGSDSQKLLLQIYSDFETVLTYHFSSLMYWITLNLLIYTAAIILIIETYPLQECIIIIFSLVFHKAKEEWIFSSSFLFYFDVKNVLFQRIENRIDKYLIPTIISSLFDFTNLIIILSNFHLLRSTKSGFYQSNLWWLKEVDVFKTLN